MSPQLEGTRHRTPRPHVKSALTRTGIRYTERVKNDGKVIQLPSALEWRSSSTSKRTWPGTAHHCQVKDYIATKRQKQRSYRERDRSEGKPTEPQSCNGSLDPSSTWSYRIVAVLCSQPRKKRRRGLQNYRCITRRTLWLWSPGRRRTRQPTRTIRNGYLPG